MRYIVERIVEDIASLENTENGEMKNFPIATIPFRIEPGDVLVLEENVWAKDEREKEERHLRIQEKMKNLWE